MATLRGVNSYHSSPGQTANWFARSASVPSPKHQPFSNMSHLTRRNAVIVVRILDFPKLVSPSNYCTVINALLRASGPVGLSAFLPPLERTYPPFDARNPPRPIPEEVPVHLPLTKVWQTTDFTLHSCLQARGPVHVREWVLRTMSRYKYVVGTLFFCLCSLYR